MVIFQTNIRCKLTLCDFCRTIPAAADACSEDNCDTDLEYGMHEDFTYYTQCKTRQRNMGLFTADQVSSQRLIRTASVISTFWDAKLENWHLYLLWLFAAKLKRQYSGRSARKFSNKIMKAGAMSAPQEWPVWQSDFENCSGGSLVSQNYALCFASYGRP